MTRTSCSHGACNRTRTGGRLKQLPVCLFVSVFFTLTGTQARQSIAIDGPGQRPHPTLVVVVTLDTCRADHCGCYGNALIKTPIIDLLSRRSIVFTDTNTDVPLTLPSHCSLMTGLPVQIHGVHSNHARLDRQTGLTAASFFAAKGFRTAAFIGGYPLLSSFGLDRGFEHYDDTMNKQIGTGTTMLERRAEDVVAATLEWTGNSDVSNKHHFIWVHCYDPHYPYEAPFPWNSIHGDEYQAEIMFTDASLGPLVRFATHHARSGVTVRFLIIGDHGEALGDHGEFTHGLFLYQASLHVPCILWEPCSRIGSGISTRFISVADLYSVLIRDFSATTGDAFLDNELDGITGKKHQYIETIFAYEKYRWHIGQGLRREDWKLLLGPIPELYDLRTDPREQNNIYYHYPEIVRELQILFEQERRGLTHGNGSAIPLDDTDRKNLGSLGYIGGMIGSPRPDNKVDLPDGKTRRECLRDIETGEQLSLHGYHEQAIPVLERARRCDPSNPDVLNNLGISYQAMGRLAEAEEAVHSAIKLAPENARFLNNLGSVLKRMGKLHEAIACFRKAYLLDPTFSATGLNLAIAEFEKGNKKRACDILRRVLEQNPDWNEARIIETRMNCPCPGKSN